MRFRRSTGDERQQLKWFVSAATLVVILLFASFTSSVVISVLQSLAFILLWASIGIAVLKYRLYEIDVVINKAVVYGALAVFITLVYVGLVVGVGALVGNQRSPLLSAIAAAIIAVAFQPVRQRAGRLANRLVYGTRATPYEVLADFADRVAGSYTIEDVLPRTAQMLAEGTGAQRADVWLRVGRELRVEGSWPSESAAEHATIAGDAPVVPGATAVVPVSHQGELLGALSVHKAPSDPMTPTDEKLLVDVASQAGLVLRNVRLIEDLRASRLRLVTAQDEARRRIARDLHDSTGQDLVALATMLGQLRNLIPSAERKSRRLVSECKALTLKCIRDIRTLSYVLHPPVLDDAGLDEAIREYVDGFSKRSGIHVELELSSRLERMAKDIELALFRVVQESLTNIQRHSGSQQAKIRVDRNPDLTLEISDQGHGPSPAEATESGDPRFKVGVGISSMQERVKLIGGRFDIDFTNHGTSVRVTIPVPTKNSIGRQTRE